MYEFKVFELMKLLLLIAVMSLSISSASADILCVRKQVPVKNGRIALSNNVKVLSRSTCPAGFSLVKNLDSIKDQQLTAFAKVSGDGAVKSFGGANVTGVNVSQPSPGRFDITFTGSFRLITADDSSSNRDLLTVNSSAIADDYGVTNNSISSASKDQISITVFVWKSSNLTDGAQAGVNVSILQGTAPLL